ncbi:damage-control phosphatase ARMT1 family protein, partial [Desulfovulcanus sp.]
HVPNLDLTLSPPALAGEVYALLSETAQSPDPFAHLKKEANERVMELLPMLKKMVASASDPLRTSLNISIIGNYIDAGIALDFNWEKAIHQEDENNWATSDYSLFLEKLDQHKKIMILGDNAGEIGLDTLLVEQLQKKGLKVVYVVREKPILNDATFEDAKKVGMTELCEVISSGVDTPGTVLERCSQEFLDRMKKTKLIISKGQGNFEALKDKWPEIFYAFKVKCPVVERLTGHPVGSSMFAYI